MFVNETVKAYYRMFALQCGCWSAAHRRTGFGFASRRGPRLATGSTLVPTRSLPAGKRRGPPRAGGGPA